MRDPFLWLFVLLFPFSGLPQEKGDPPKRLSIEKKIALCREKIAEQKKNQTKIIAESIAVFTANDPTSPQSHRRRDILLDLGPSIAHTFLRHMKEGKKQSHLADNSTMVLSALAKKYQVRTILPDLLELLKVPSKTVRRRALFVLKEYKEKALPTEPLLEAYQSEEETSIRASILEVLAGNRSPEAEPLIMEALKNSSMSLRLAAARSASRMQLVKALPFLGDLLKDDREEVREAALHALRNFNGPALLTVLCDRLSADAPERTVEVIQLIAEKGDRSSIQHLQRFAKVLLKRKDNKTRELLEEAVFALNRLGDDSLNDEILAGPRREMQRNPNNYSNIYHLGQIYFRLMKYETAIKCFNKIATHNRAPFDLRIAIHTEIARCYSLLGEIKKALDSLEKARIKDASIIETDPDFENVKKDGRYRKKFSFFSRTPGNRRK